MRFSSYGLAAVMVTLLAANSAMSESNRLVIDNLSREVLIVGEIQTKQTNGMSTARCQALQSGLASGAR